jgi:CDP-4-dehydro-6-deoxyglucose reductase
MRARLLEAAEIAPAVGHFLFEAEGVERLDFLPGQWVSFTGEVAGKPVTRAYSVASAPAGTNRFELCLNLVEGGHLSPRLFGMKPGDSIAMQAPMGTFTWRNPGRAALLIATGTGVAPFRAMLQAHGPTISAPVTLLFGTRYESGLLYRAEFEAAARRWPRFRYWPTLTRPSEGWGGRRGRVQAHVLEALPQAAGSSTDVYLCGLKAMVDQLRHMLKEMGLSRRQIFYEKYD